MKEERKRNKRNLDLDNIKNHLKIKNKDHSLKMCSLIIIKIN
jgi:hypothetical protein